MMTPRRLLSVASFAIAAVALAAAAHAYSAAAVQDAQEVLKRTTTRFEYGEVDKADLALAKYYFLEMKYRATQTSLDEFCRAAKPELTLVAQQYEEPEGQTGQKQKWLEQVVAMDGSHTTCEQAIAMTAMLLFGEAAQDYSDAALKAAEAFVAATRERYQDGEVTATDVAQAEYQVMEIKYGAKQTSRTDYCQAALPLLQRLAHGMADEEAMGQRWLQDEIAAKRTLFRVTALCAA